MGVAYGPSVGVRFFRQRGVCHALGDLLARAHRIGRVVERHRQERQAEQGDAAQACQAGRAVQRALQGQRDAPFDLFSRLSGEQRDDLNLSVGRIGETPRWSGS